MSQQAGGSRGRRAWTVQWRNYQGRKNKSWEFDGYMLVSGLGVTVHSDEGKLLGARNLDKLPEEDDEFSIGNKKEVRVGDEISLKEYSRNVKAVSVGSDVSVQSPARAVPGYLTRPGMVGASSPLGTSTPHVHAAVRPTAIQADADASVDTPMSAEKRWQQPNARVLTPFKPPTPATMAKRSTVDEVSAAFRASHSKVKTASDGGPHAQPLTAQGARAGRESQLKQQTTTENDVAYAAEPAPKRRRIESVGPHVGSTSRPTSRLSAADAAFELAVSRTPASAKSASLDDSLSGSSSKFRPLFREEPTHSADHGLLSDGDELQDLLSDGDEDDLNSESQASKPAPTRSLGGSTSGPKLGSSVTRYTCQWRKRTQKKHPTWEADGVLLVHGQRAELTDTSTGKRLGSVTLGKPQVDEGAILRIGELEVEVGEALVHQAPSSPDVHEKSSTASLIHPTAQALQPFRPPAPAKSVNPLAKRMAPREPDRARKLTPLATAQASVPSTSTTFKMPGLADMSVVSSLSAYGPRESQKIHRFDPNVEGAIVMRRPDKAHEETYNKRGLPIVDVVVDPLIGDKLRDHQKEGVKFMYECVMGMRTAGQGCLLADDMGLGKTIQSIALIWTLLKQNPYRGGKAGVIQRAMIVCPITLMKNWSAEIKKWLGRDKLRVYVADTNHPISTFARNKSYDVLIVGYDKVRSYIDEVKFAQPPIGLIVCDEGHRLKSDKAKTTQALQSLSCMRRLILTGTPIQNNLGEFFAMMDFVNPGLLNDYAYFKKNFEMPILASRQPHATPKQKAAGEEAFESLSVIQRNFVLRRTNDIILKHLPPKFEYTVFIRPTQLQLELYRNVVSSSLVKTMLEGIDCKQGLPLLQSVLKLSTSPGLVIKHIQEKGLGYLDESILEVLPPDADAADFALSGKLSVLGSLLAELRKVSDEKIVVVSNFTTTLDLIETHCKRKKYPYCRLDGKTPQMDRVPMVEAFNRGSQKNQFVFLLSSKGGGSGLNIIGASRLVQIDSDWNPSNDLQAMARIHREGQKRPCFIYRFLTAGMVDEVIFQRQIIKLALSGSVMDKDGNAAAKSKDAFTLDELRNLFTLHDQVACRTHDLTGCRCHFGEVPADDDDDDDATSDNASDEADEPEGFVQASQLQGDDAVRKLVKDRRNLSILKTWTHYDCTSEEAIESLEDDLLQTILYQRMSKAGPTELPLETEGNGTLSLRGGQIGFVFGKKSAVPE